MSILPLLISVSLGLGLVGLGAFAWSLRNGQFEDPAGDAERILLDTEDRPLQTRQPTGTTRKEGTQ